MLKHEKWCETKIVTRTPLSGVSSPNVHNRFYLKETLHGNSRKILSSGELGSFCWVAMVATGINLPFDNCLPNQLEGIYPKLGHRCLRVCRRIIVHSCLFGHRTNCRHPLGKLLDSGAFRGPQSCNGNHWLRMGITLKPT